MGRPVSEIQQDIRELAYAEKEEILTMLMAELDGPADEGTESAWGEEVARRSHEIDSGVVQCIPADEVLARVDKILGR